jgi:hypothetical protein
MTDTTELKNKLTKLHKFNTEKLSKFSEFQKYTFETKRREFFNLNELLRTSIAERESLKNTIKQNAKSIEKGVMQLLGVILLGTLLFWFFDSTESAKNSFTTAIVIGFVYVYFNNRITETQNNLHLISKTDSIKFYELLLNNLIGRAYLEYEVEWKKLIQKRADDFYRIEIKDETEEDKLVELVFSAEVNRAIIEDITGEKSYSYLAD